MALKYERFLKEEFLLKLADEEKLRFLLEDPAIVLKDRHAIDIQIRRDNKIQFYHGLTSLLTVQHRVRKESYDFSAAHAYGNENKPSAQCYSNLMKPWSLSKDGDIQDLRERFCEYLSRVVSCADGGYRKRREGYWQNLLCVEAGRFWKPQEPWLVVDRECVIGHHSTCERRDIKERIATKYREFQRSLQSEDSTRWGKPGESDLGNELDVLAIGPDKELVCIELKYEDNVDGIYWGPLQTMVYQELFSEDIEVVSRAVYRIVLQKVAVGLLPPLALTRLPNQGETFTRVCSALVVAKPRPERTCWANLKEVMRRCPEAKVPVFQMDWSDQSGISLVEMNLSEMIRD